MRLHSLTLLAPLLLSLPSTYSFSCSLSPSSIPYDLSPLTGVRETSRVSETPPTTSEAKVFMELCKEGGLGKEDGLSDEDQCPSNTRVCVKLTNHKPSSSEPDRITAVIPIWTTDIPDEDVFTTPMGKNGEEGLKIYVNGPEYAGVRQHLNLSLICDPKSDTPQPTLVSFTAGLLSLEWATPDACPRNGDGDTPISDGGSGSGESGTGGSGGGFFAFLRFVFWLAVIALVLYFAIGIFYNHQQYSARGWDLIPHRDFWREVPVLLQDLFSHVFAGLRGGSSGGGRGGYSSLG
ncbi:hypothetical protein CI109_104246 [Kwoniella shandongensis]|uniref:Autophagy-related protein 27 n=1 Tax=Kwoniella shandongensis TaxID=1734106 RepID=A0A5M6C248_9TREE|nr:uncharacterized protein CI109_002848 [Kwoniella shandongensis]KAA5528690.1 hypothetical protein CI109_002848 [Kwoniella shandongensis]